MKAMDDFVAAYHVSLPAIRDVEFKLDDFVGATAPEAFLVSPKGHTLYKGAIDNKARGMGQHRTVSRSWMLYRAEESCQTSVGWKINPGKTGSP
jgi:hypothetical protein